MIEVIEYYNQAISDWIKAYYADGVFLLLAIAAFIYLYVNCKELRYKFLLPVFLMLFIAVNPVLYTYIFRRIIYWRLLWMLPTAVLVATAVVVLLKRFEKLWMKWGLLLVITAFVVSQGEYMFSNGVFTPRSNWEKLPQETIDVCNIMLELDETPRAVVHSGIVAEMRQYAPEIELMYGREVNGYYLRNPNMLAMLVYRSLQQAPRDYNHAFWRALTEGYSFFVNETAYQVEEHILNQYGYKKVGETLQHTVYYNVNANYFEQLKKEGDKK